jgi:hypothetical protein
MTIRVTYNKQKKMTTIATHKAKMFECATKLECKNVRKEAHIDLYLLLIELITTTQHHILHCKKDLPIKPKTQKNSMLFEFHLNSTPSLHNLIATPFGELFNNNLIYKCTHEGMATNWNECYKNKTMTKLVENYKCNRQ